jgi:hypothetical protein
MPENNCHFRAGTVWTAVPAVEDVTAAQVASRVFPDITGGATLAGAAQGMVFNIYLPDA